MSRIVEPKDFLSAFENPMRVVLATFGASGGHVMVAGGDERISLDDGYRAIEQYRPEGALEREATALLMDAAKSQHDAYGDGTSTTMILLHAMIVAGLTMRETNPAHKVLSDMEAGIDAVKGKLREMSKYAVDEETLIKVATLSMHGDKELGKMVGSLAWRLGEYGRITASMKSGGDVEVVEEEGFIWGGGVLDDSMLNNGSRAEFENCLILMANGKWDNIQDKLWALVMHEVATLKAKTGIDHKVVFVCPDGGGSVASTFVKQGWVVVRPPVEIPIHLFMSDLQAVVGGIVIDEKRGSMSTAFTAAHFGSCANFLATKPFSVVKVVNGSLNPERVDRRIAEVKEYYGDASVRDNDTDKGVRDARLACLAGRVGDIRVPYISETHFAALKEVVEDGFFAARQARKGVVPGGGFALAKTVKFSPEFNEDRVWVRQVFFSPIECNFGSVLNGIGDDWEVYDLRAGVSGDAMDLGVIDPLESTIGAITNAWSVARQVISTNLLIER